MKKTGSILLCTFLIAASGCASSVTAARPTETAKPAPTTVEATAPISAPTETPRGTARAAGIGVFYRCLERGEELYITGERDGYYTAELSDGGKVYVDKRYIRTEYDAPSAVSYAARTAYGAKLFETVRLKGEYMEPAPGSALEVLDSLNGVAMVEYNGIVLYMAESELSAGQAGVSYEEYTKTYTPESQGSDAPGGADTVSGGNGNDVSGGTGIDGGDISLASYTRAFDEPHIILLSAAAERRFPCKGSAFSDTAELYLLLTEAGEQIEIHEYDERLCTICIGGRFGTLPRWALIIDSGDAYTPWTAYAKHGATLYDAPELKGLGTRLSENEELEVIYECGDALIVVYDGHTAFIARELASPDKAIIAHDYGGTESERAAEAIGQVPENNEGGDWTAPPLSNKKRLYPLGAAASAYYNYIMLIIQLFSRYFSNSSTGKGFE